MVVLAGSSPISSYAIKIHMQCDEPWCSHIKIRTDDQRGRLLLAFHRESSEYQSKELVPYLMCGANTKLVTSPIVMSNVRSNMVNGRNSSNVVYDIGIGSFIKITKKLLLDFNYKQLDPGSTGIKSASSAFNSPSNSHAKEFMLDIVYKF